MSRAPTPGPVVIPQGMEIKARWQNSGQTFVNVWHARVVTAGAIDDVLAETLFGGFKTQLTSSGFAGQLADSTSFTGVSVKDLRQANMPEYNSSGTAAAGADATGELPEQVALCVTGRTNRSGREFRGRTYFGGLGLIAQADARSFTGAAGIAAKAFMDGIIQVAGSNGLQIGVGQRALQAGSDIHGNPLPARAAQMVDYTATEIRDHRFDTQRRRLGR